MPDSSPASSSLPGPTADGRLKPDITTWGRSDSIPIISFAGPVPFGVELIDNRNGTAVLSITDSPAPGSQAAVSISADVGYFADTAQFILETFSATANAVTVAPNPFSESVRILISAEVGIRSAVTIYNTSGERIWGQVNNSGILADTSIVWNGRNSKGKATAAGIFILHVRAASYEGRLKLLKTN